MNLKARYKAFYQTTFKPSHKEVSKAIGIDYNHFLKWQKGKVVGPFIEKKIENFLEQQGF